MPFTFTLRSANIGLKPTVPLAAATPFPSTPNVSASAPLESVAVERFSRRRSVFVSAYRAGRPALRSSTLTVYPLSAALFSRTSHGAEGGGAGVPPGGGGRSFTRSALPSFSRTTARKPAALSRLPRTNACLAKSTDVSAIVSDAALKNGSFSPFLLRRGDLTSTARPDSWVASLRPVVQRYRVFKP